MTFSEFGSSVMTDVAMLFSSPSQGGNQPFFHGRYRRYHKKQGFWQAFAG